MATKLATSAIAGVIDSAAEARLENDAEAPLPLLPEVAHAHGEPPAEQHRRTRGSPHRGDEG